MGDSIPDRRRLAPTTQPVNAASAIGGSAVAGSHAAPDRDGSQAMPSLSVDSDLEPLRSAWEVQVSKKVRSRLVTCVGTR